MSTKLDQFNAALKDISAKAEAEKARLAAEAKRLADSQVEVEKFLEWFLEEGFRTGRIDPRVIAVTLERSEEPKILAMTFANRVLTDDLYGLSKAAGKYIFNDSSYESLAELEAAVVEFLGVYEVPHFREVVRGVLNGSPLVEPQMRRLELPAKSVYDKSKLTTEHTLYITTIESY